MPTRKATAVWQGGLQKGNGTFKGQTGLAGQYNFSSRFENGAGSNPASLADIPAFTEFTRDIADRCVVQPVARGAHIVGSHRFLPD